MDKRKEIEAGFGILAHNWRGKMNYLSEALMNPIVHSMLAEIDDTGGWIISTPPMHNQVVQVTDGKEVVAACYNSDGSGLINNRANWKNFIPKGINVIAWKPLSSPPNM